MRGITPVIAIILLLLMTVAAAGAAYLWITMIQKQISTQTETGLESNLKQMHGRLSLESVWNTSGAHICSSIRNSGTIAYTATELGELTYYINDRAFKYNKTSVLNLGTTDFGTGEVLTICMCNSTEQTNVNCTGPTPDGYDYAGAKINVRVEPPMGAGDTYANYQG